MSSFRQFEEPDHASLYKKYREKPPARLIERILEFLREKYTGPLTQAVDLGCGSGQCTFLLSKHFKTVLGTDISQAQISQAQQGSAEEECNNVNFCVSPAETIALEDHSVQLITACVAAHWFDLDKVYEEGRRVLCDGGVMAFLCMDYLIVEIGDDLERNKQFSKIMQDVHKIMDPYFAPPAALAFNKYRDITIPYSDLTREYDYEIGVTTNLSKILGAIKSYSAFQTFCKVKGEDEGNKLMQDVKDRFLEIATIPDNNLDANVFTLKRRYFVVMARV